ncbi:MAG: ion channel [Acidobacteriota bacterium]
MSEQPPGGAAATRAFEGILKSNVPLKEGRDLGFGSVVARQARGRFLNRDGTFNVRRGGLGFLKSLSLYHGLLTVTWPRFLLFLSIGYLLVNLAFASAFYLCGPLAFGGMHSGFPGGRFVECYFFSVQTFATIGYGAISPLSLSANLLVVLESVTGLLLVALGTGISFARFSRPTAKVLFSDRAIIGPYRDITAFEFRIVNARDKEIIELQAKVLISRRLANGDREFKQLELERDAVPFFPLSWTVVHPIDQASPLWGTSENELLAQEAEFLILLQGIDETFSQTVYTRSSYKAHEIDWGVNFASVYNPPDEDGGLSIDVRKLSATEKR